MDESRMTSHRQRIKDHFARALRAHGRTRHRDHEAAGTTLHSPRLYDWIVVAYSLGREGKLRQRTLDVTGVAAGEHVLDVGCGTGTLALAARQRVGPTGSVHGIDASAEMISRARSKAARRGLPVSFEVATAQSLPFPDATFDVVSCSLALHHLPETARPRAIEEMRRVVKPGGRIVIVEFGRPGGVRAWLHPIALLHARTQMTSVLEEAVDLLKRIGCEDAVTAPLGFGTLAYTVARCR